VQTVYDLAEKSRLVYDLTESTSELLPERVSPELRHLQAKLAAQLPYRQAPALLEELLSETDGLN
jgi:hypothetical protein